ncbi:hypothetical protein BDV59DRAFT_206139 [Aspergillus ambiguus]|uniref:GPI anchored serine-threonine rich protein n=1 Tax=Aspergillus ambiguus TaxID=176160 RepID=UPI003CCD3841
MHFHTAALAALIGITTASAGSAKCDAQDILDACLNSMKPQMENCSANDWKCLCEQSNNVLTCALPSFAPPKRQ